jgi:HlyD family secretion protein
MMRRTVPLSIILGVSAAVLSALGFWYHRSEAQPIVYATTQPAFTEIVKKVTAPGALVPRREVTIKPHVSGVIEKLLVAPGEPVKAGAVVAKIRVMPNMVQVDAAEMKVKGLQIQLDSARHEAARFGLLNEQGLVSATEYNRYLLAARLGEAELDAAESNRDLLLKGSSAKSARVANVVISTVQGTVLDVPVKEGSSVIEANPFNEGTTIASVADMGDMIFQGRVEESEIGKLREGMPLVIAVGALSSERLDGKLEYIAPKGSEKDGTIEFEVKAALTLKPGVAIRANYSATAEIVVERRERALAIDERTVSFEGGQSFVEVETAPQHFERRAVALGLSDGNNVEVLSGLSADARIKRGASEQGAH